MSQRPPAPALTPHEVLVLAALQVENDILKDRIQELEGGAA